MKIVLTILLILLPFFSLSAAEKCDFIKFNECLSCDSRFAFSVSSEEICTFFCPNREVNYKGSGSAVINYNCVLKECPPEFPYRTDYGSCYKTKQEAEDNFYYDYGESKKEEYLEGEYLAAPLAVDGKCPPERPLLYSKRCFSCQAVDDLSISEEECQKCPNRVYRVYPNWGVAHCEIPCPTDKPLQRWDGACFSCDEPGVIRLKTHCNLEDDCEFCPNRTILYDIGGSVPSVPNCPPDKPLMDDEGFCFPCDTPVKVGVRWNTSLCQRFCPNERHLVLENCVLNK